MKKFIITFVLITINIALSNQAQAQVYTEKQSRHRFAQMNVGLNLKMATGGFTKYINETGNIERLDLANSYEPSIIIGGTHFWGHADFELIIPVYSQSQELNDQKIFFTGGVETTFKFYPWRIEHNRLRPFIGTSIAPFYFTQDNNLMEFGDGPERSFTRLPLLMGFSYNRGQHLINLGLSYNYSNQLDLAISKTQIERISTPPLAFNLSYKYMFDTTLGAEKDWESGRTQEITDKLAEFGKLNNFYVGIGLSSAWWLAPTDLNREQYSFIPKYGTNIMPEFSLGYYFHKPDLDISANYRGYTGGANVYGVAQSARRRSLAFEVKKFLFDYHGFTPFVGPTISLESLLYRQRIEGGELLEQSNNQMAYGIVFGWDIRPNRIQTFILRTNLRYFPNLNLKDVQGTAISYDNIEFNFIQLILYPGRMF